MATLAANAPIIKVLGEVGSIPIIADDIVYEGAMVGENGSGYGRPLVAGDPFMGHSANKVDNTDGSAGDLDISLITGRYRLEVSLAGSITDVGKPVYASDDATLSLLAPDNTFVGVVTRYVSASKMIVEFRPGEKYIGIKETYAETISDVDYQVPIAVQGLTAAGMTCADDSHDDVTLGQITVLTGNTVEAIVGDIGTASAGRRTCAKNSSGGTALVTVADESNTTINAQGKRISLEDEGWVILEETGNDAFIIVAGAGVSLVAFAA